MFKTIKRAWSTPEIRKRLLYTLLLIVVFRFGCYIVAPGVDSVALEKVMSSNSGFGGIMDIVSGGAFARFTIFAMSIGPYITAQIVIQLLTMVIPSLEKLTKDGGEVGRQKINKYTKILSLVLATVEAVGVYLSYKNQGVFVDDTELTGFILVLSLVTGTSLLMWLGEQITQKGIGNGISMLILVGILDRLPTAIKSVFGLIVKDSQFETTGLIIGLAILIGAIILIAAVVFVHNAERKVPVQYSKKVVGRKMVGAQNTHIPIKPAMAGVMPIIFASSFMTFPSMIIPMFNSEIASQSGFWSVIYKFSLATSSSNVGWGYSLANALVYLLLIVGFTFFYTYATFNPAEVSANIKKNGGFIPGIRAGKPTTEYLSSVVSKLTVFGGIYLAIVAILPMFMRFTSLDVTFGGTSILIIVGVAIETVQQLESLLVMRHYKGFLG